MSTTNPMSKFSTTELNKKIATGNLSPEDLASAQEIVANRNEKTAPKAKVEKPKAEKVAKPKAEKTEAPKTEKVAKEKTEKPKAEKVAKVKAEKVVTPKAEKPAKVKLTPKVIDGITPNATNLMTPETALKADQIVSFLPARNSKFRSAGVQEGKLLKVYDKDEKGDEWLRIEIEGNKKIFKLKKAILAHN